MKAFFVSVWAAGFSLWMGTFALAQDLSTTPSTVLSIEFTERPVKREVPIAPYRLTFQCDDARRFRVSYEPLAAEGAAPELVRTEGELLPAEWDDVQSALRGVNLPPDAPSKLDIGYGTSSTPGWEGKLFFRLDGVAREVAFTSLRPSDGQARPVALNRLVTLIFDLKNFGLAKLQRLPPRAAPPSSVPQ